jgi:hypothetical protein
LLRAVYNQAESQWETTQKGKKKKKKIVLMMASSSNLNGDSECASYSFYAIEEEALGAILDKMRSSTAAQMRRKLTKVFGMITFSFFCDFNISF